MAKNEVNQKQANKNEKNKKTFFKSLKTELKKVVWPTPKQLVNNTVTVVTIVLICAIIIYALDLLFSTVNKQGIDRIRDMVVTSESPEATNNTTSENATSEENSTTIQVNDDGTTEVVDDNTDSETDIQVDSDNTTETEGENTQAE